MTEYRRFCPHRLEDGNLDACVGDVIFAADDVGHIHVDVIEHMEPFCYFPPDEPMKEDPTHQLFGQQGLYWRSTGDGHEGLGRFSNDDDLLRAWRDARLRDQESGTTGVEDEEDNGLDAD